MAALEADGSPSSEYPELEEQLAELNEEQRLLNDLRDRVDGEHPETGQDYYLLGFDTEGEGQAIVSVGNPDTADNVNVYVPGTGSDLGGAGYDDGGLMNRVDEMAHDAKRFATDQETATVLWLGYDAPDNVYNEAIDTKYAEEAADDLSRFADGIRATADGEPSNLTMTGHSYGSTTVGTAARDEGLAVDNMIFIGSPGVGVDSAEDLGINPDNVWASRNPADVIQFTMFHGEDPTGDEFGGNTFFSDVSRDLSRWNPGPGMIDNHSAYWDEGNVSRENMALIVTGQEKQAT